MDKGLGGLRIRNGMLELLDRDGTVLKYKHATEAEIAVWGPDVHLDVYAPIAFNSLPGLSYNRPDDATEKLRGADEGDTGGDEDRDAEEETSSRV